MVQPKPDLKPKKKGRGAFVVALVLLIVALLAAGVLVYRYWSQQNAYKELETYVDVEDSSLVKLADLTVDWDALRDINPDIVGWIYIPNSTINYPIVQGPDNEKYLDTAFDGSNGWFSSAGTIFIDAKNDANFLDRNTFLYGHHMRDGSMFASIADWESNAEFNAHRDIYILTPDGNYYAKTFSLMKTTGSDPIVVTQFASDDTYQTYIQNALNRSIVKQEGTVFTADQIKQSFALCTCEYTQNDGRDLLFATVVATTVKDDPYVEYDPDALTGFEKD
jgi:sortase B